MFASTQGRSGMVSVHGVNANLALMDAPASNAKTRRIENVSVAIVAIEWSAVVATCYLTSVIYYTIVLEQWPPALQYVPTGCLIASLMLLAAAGLRQYAAVQAQPRDRYLWGGVAAVTLAFSLFLSILFVFKVTDTYSRGTFFSQFVGVNIALLITRGAIHSYLRQAVSSGNVEARKAVLIGEAPIDGGILGSLRQFGIQWAGVLQFPLGNPADASSTTVRAFVERCRGLKPDDIIFLAAPADLPRIAALVDALSELPVTVHVIPTGASGIWGSAQIANLGETVTIQVLRPPLSQVDLALKRAFDICVAGLSLILVSPLLLLVSLAIKVDSPGPVFFRQNRHGYNNEPIPVLKFRTMKVLEDGETASTFTQARQTDPRLTRLGRFLRRTNIDELPQLLNILRGEMSVVGPRPHPIALNAIFQERIAPFSRRHRVKPGLTGWAQVHGYRGATDTLEKMQRRIDHDLYYIDNWSMMLDLKILIMTLFSRSAYSNAY